MHSHCVQLDLSGLVEALGGALSLCSEPCVCLGVLSGCVLKSPLRQHAVCLSHRSVIASLQDPRHEVTQLSHKQNMRDYPSHSM